MLRVLYRGPLESCNYDCGYCPFGKVSVREDELQADFAALDRFVRWALGQDRELGVFFTPWGEALVHAPYTAAITGLSHHPSMQRVAIQTNLSAPLGWLADAKAARVAFWATFHPGFASLDGFLRRVGRVCDAGARISVGVVAQREHFDAIAGLHRRLPPDVYLWLNANKRLAPGYSERERAFLRYVDPLFELNRRPHASLGLPCRTGEHAITVDGKGAVRRCHFVPEVIGSLAGDLELAPRACPNPVCRCHIGYVHLPSLGLDEVFGDGILERIPRAGWPGWATLAARRAQPLAPWDASPRAKMLATYCRTSEAETSS